jgi:hypothetical protein
MEKYSDVKEADRKKIDEKADAFVKGLGIEDKE